MSDILTDSVISIINNPNSIKALATVDKEGCPHLVYKSTIMADDNGYIRYSELIESSKTNKNMVYSIWNEKNVAINVLYEEKSFQIIGKIYKAIIYGREFEPYYIAAKEEFQADLSTVWLIEPINIVENTLQERIIEEQNKHPLFRHLDQI